MVFNWFIIALLGLITLYVLHKKTFRYIDAFLFFMPFNATVVFYVLNKTAINLPFFLFFLAAIFFFFRKFFTHKYSIKLNRFKNYGWIVLIVLIAVISQIMPFIINGSYFVLDRYKSTIYWAKEEPLYPSIQWVTQLIYFIVGFLIIFVINETYQSFEEIKKGLKYLLLGIVFMIFWGWLGSFFFLLDIPYPQIFNQIGMNEFGVMPLNGLPRMSSTTLEPSYFAQILIPATPYFYWFWQEEGFTLFKRKTFKYLFFISLITLLAAITTTGVLGFVILIGFLLKNRLRFYTLRSRYVLVSLYSIVSFFLIYFVVQYLINVSETYSGIERFKTVVYGFNYFKDYPILGLGWGVFPVHDFIINLLANFGVLGTIPFLIYLLKNFLVLQAKKKLIKSQYKPLFNSATESFVLILIVSQLSGFNYHSQYFWVYIGVSTSVGMISLKRSL